LLATLTVNTTADENSPDATLSLREAIEIANGTLAFSALSPQEQAQVSGSMATPDTIAFDIPGSGTQTIVLGSPLPALAQAVTIDGTTQPGYSATAPPLIVLDGSQAGTTAVGLKVNPSTPVTIQGLGVNSFARGIDFLANAAASNLNHLAFSGETTAAISGEGNLGNSAFSNITILGAVANGIAIAGNAGASSFTSVAISGATGGGIVVGGTANSSSFTQVAISLASASSDGIQIVGNAGSSVFSHVAVNGAGADGLALGASNGSTFMNVAISAAGRDGLVINGDATAATYTNVAISLNSGSSDGLEITGVGSNSAYQTISVLNPGKDGIAIGTATQSTFSNLTVIGAGHDAMIIDGDGSSSSYTGLVLALANGGNTGFTVAGALSMSSLSKVTISGVGGNPPQFAGGVSVGSDAMGTTFGPITVFGAFNFGIQIAGNASSSQFSNNVIQDLGPPAAPTVGITATGDGVLVSGNVITGPFMDGLDFVTSVGGASAIASNVINTQGVGVGILLHGASGVEVAVGCNNLSGNAVGAKLVGDGVDVGIIDMGGGPLGSATVMTGGNTFDQTGAAGTLAISLTQTAASALVNALGNAFADLGAIQDATHHGGSGVIAVSIGTSTCPGTLAIVMGGFSVAEGTPYNGPVAFYTVYQPVPPGPFSATITWGDGSTSAGTISQPGGTGTPFVVSGTHTYAAAGVYATSVTVLDDTTSYVAPTPGAAVVTDPAPIINVSSLRATAGAATGVLPIATFTDPGTPHPVDQYTATIDWGDKSPPIFGVVTVSGPTYTVSGGHTYASVGLFTITVTVQDQTSPPASMTGQATVVTRSTTALAPPAPNPSNAGQSVSFVATVTAASAGVPPPPAGELITFLDGTTTLGTAPLNGAGVATFTTSGLTPGSHTIGAEYPGDTLYEPSTAPTVVQMVLSPPVLAATVTQLSSSANPSGANQTVTFTAVVTPSARPGTGTPTGTVTFTIDGQAQTPVPLAVVGGQDEATFSTATLVPGGHMIGASYSGDTAFAPSTAPALAQTVNPGPPPPPAVVTPARFGYHAQPTKLVIIFSAALDPARAQNVAEYHVVAVVKGRHNTAQLGRTIAVVGAVYDPTHLTVTLSFARRLNVHGFYQITINGTPPNGLTSPSGQFLDGQGNGQAGSNYVQVFGPGILQGPVPAATASSPLKSKAILLRL
jgi:CSLREA domain-containing protein